MLLAVDIGNTNIVLGLFDNSDLKHRWRLDSYTRRSEDEWHLLVQSLLANVGLSVSTITDGAISSVVPGITPIFVSLLQNRVGVIPVLISNKLNLGISNKYDEPDAVGADRLCNAVAGYDKYQGPLTVIDFGTATTFDVISKKGEYLGGIIAPGLETAAQELHIHAAKLPSVELQFPDKVIGTSTEQSIQAGIMYGTIGLVEGIINRINRELKESAKVVATGGLAPLIIEKTDYIQCYEPDLTLIGIEKIYRLVTQSSDKIDN